ncbi:MAG: hypothetical protein J0I41_20345 [Filimonas sp.]|nr:hypothetical protein [Filimonas sp.]
MTRKTIKVIDLFNTSLGLAAILEFPDKEMPFAGMKVTSALNEEWVISQIGMLSSKETKYVNISNCWNCIIRPLKETNILGRQDVLIF